MTRSPLIVLCPRVPPSTVHNLIWPIRPLDSVGPVRNEPLSLDTLPLVLIREPRQLRLAFVRALAFMCRQHIHQRFSTVAIQRDLVIGKIMSGLSTVGVRVEMGFDAGADRREAGVDRAAAKVPDQIREEEFPEAVEGHGVDHFGPDNHALDDLCVVGERLEVHGEVKRKPGEKNSIGSKLIWLYTEVKKSRGGEEGSLILRGLEGVALESTR